jgi:ABC-type enterochelin transport system permease subunit
MKSTIDFLYQGPTTEEGTHMIILTSLFFVNSVAAATIVITADVATVSGSLTAPNIYSKTEIDNLLIPKATVTYVGAQLTLKCQPIYHIYQN